MTLRQTIQAAPAKAGEIIEKLSNTSNNAVKTRESLFADLSAELTLYVDLEEQHLLPLLRKHPETKGLFADAAKGNKELRTRLTQLAAAPKDDDAFAEKLKELRAGFQHYVRNERKELLPAVLKALDEEEAQATEEKIKDGISEAEEAKREKRRTEAAAAKQQAEAAEAVLEAEREVARMERAATKQAKEAAEKMADTLQSGARAAEDSARQVAGGVMERTLQAASGAQEALASYSGTVRDAAENLRAVSESTRISATGLSQLTSTWVDWAERTARLNSEATRQLFQCRSLSELAEVQRDFVTSATRNLIEGNAKLLELSQQTSKQALRPLEHQLGK